MSPPPHPWGQKLTVPAADGADLADIHPCATELLDAAIVCIRNPYVPERVHRHIRRPIELAIPAAASTELGEICPSVAEFLNAIVSCIRYPDVPRRIYFHTVRIKKLTVSTAKGAELKQEITG